ncbi:MAG TPA: IclR family transcriptional regulator C-terminal domain-containing protein, partial [Chloroflexota bacterium]|nr:IclR family transcriptional regulator C-terminal domain-containing protein [Chloroflexota bacterium]
TFDRVMAQRELIAFTPRTLVQAEEFRRHLGLVAARGWAVDDEEYALGLRCIAAPVRDAGGRVVAAIGISGPATRVTLERVETLAQQVVQTATRMSSALGFRADSDPS